MLDNDTLSIVSCLASKNIHIHIRWLLGDDDDDDKDDDDDNADDE